MRPREIRGHAQSDKARASQSKPELRIFKRKYKGNQNTEFPIHFHLVTCLGITALKTVTSAPKVDHLRKPTV